VWGELQAVNPEPSREHANEDPASVAPKVKIAVEEFVCPDGPEVIIVLGGASTVHIRSALVWSVLPAASVALTSNVWLPSDKPP
jgi:hypothetical protein